MYKCEIGCESNDADGSPRKTELPPIHVVVESTIDLVPSNEYVLYCRDIEPSISARAWCAMVCQSQEGGSEDGRPYPNQIHINGSDSDLTYTWFTPG